MNNFSKKSMLKDYIVLDLETTGLSKDRHKITEIAAIKVSNNKIENKFEQLVNPNVRIPSFITRLTGIDNEMVKNKPSIDEVLPKFLKFLKDDVMIAHNATFDHGFISSNAYLLNQEFLNERLCTMKLAYRLTNLPSRKLSSLCAHFNISNNQAHRAMSDVKATYQVFDKFNKDMHSKGVKTKEDIFKFEKMSLRELREKIL